MAVTADLRRLAEQVKLHYAVHSEGNTEERLALGYLAQANRLAALERELSDEAVIRYVEMDGGKAVHRLWRDTMRDQGRSTEYREDWDSLAIFDQVLDRAIARGLLLDFLGHVSASISGKAALDAAEKVGEVTNDPWPGRRMRMADGCIRDHADWPRGERARDSKTITGTALGPPVFVEQDWLPVKWDDRDDPEFCKLSCLAALAAAGKP